MSNSVPEELRDDEQISFDISMLSGDNFATPTTEQSATPPAKKSIRSVVWQMRRKLFGSSDRQQRPSHNKQTDLHYLYQIHYHLSHRHLFRQLHCLSHQSYHQRQQHHRLAFRHRHLFMHHRHLRLNPLRHSHQRHHHHRLARSVNPPPTTTTTVNTCF